MKKTRHLADVHLGPVTLPEIEADSEDQEEIAAQCFYLIGLVLPLVKAKQLRGDLLQLQKRCEETLGWEIYQ